MNGDVARRGAGDVRRGRRRHHAGLCGYEAGQSGVGDIFAWFVEHQLPKAYHDEAARRGLDPHEHLSELAAAPGAGEHGLVALDWHSGNRSVLVDHELSGVIVGLTLRHASRRTSTARSRGDRVRRADDRRDVRGAGVPVASSSVAGGLIKNALLMQIYSDVLRRAART